MLVRLENQDVVVDVHPVARMESLQETVLWILSFSHNTVLLIVELNVFGSSYKTGHHLEANESCDMVKMVKPCETGTQTALKHCQSIMALSIYYVVLVVNRVVCF